MSEAQELPWMAGLRSSQQYLIVGAQVGINSSCQVYLISNVTSPPQVNAF